MHFKKFYYGFLILVNCCYASFGQSDTLRWTENTKLKTGDISVSENLRSNDVEVHLRYSYWLETTMGRGVRPIVKADAILNRKLSSLADSSLLNLKYAQVIFDIMGYHSKLLKSRAMELGVLNGTEKEVRNQVENVFFQVEMEVGQLSKDFDLAVREENSERVLTEWSAKINQLIEKTPNVLVDYQISKWQIGIFLGLGRQFLFGHTKTYFTDPTSINFGFEVDVKKNRLALDLNLGLNKTSQHFERKGDWQPGLKSNLTVIELTYGRKFQKNKVLLVPYFGIAVNEFTPRSSQEGDRRRLTGYCPVIGAELNRIFLKTNREFEATSFFYKIKLSFSPTNFVKNLDGTQVNLRLALGGSSIRHKRRISYN